MLSVLFVSLASACGQRPNVEEPSAESAPVESADATNSDSEARAFCTEEEARLLARVDESRERACASAADCSVITNPLNVHLQVVVHALDAARLSERIASMQGTCGSQEFDPSTFQTVETRCIDELCDALRTTFTPEPIE